MRRSTSGAFQATASLRTSSDGRTGEYAKRALDLCAALLLLLALSPVFLLCALAVRIDSRGPILYRCRRVGRHHLEFEMLKFRKMRDGVAGPRLTGAHDERFTRVGGLLAKFKLDELPQLINVVRGEMSLVGPRPEDAAFVALARPEFDRILQVRPGVTGLSQLAFACESEILDRARDRDESYVNRLFPQKIALDQLYAGTRTLGMDLRIMAWTVVAVALRRPVAVHRDTGRLARRRRPERAIGSLEAG